MLYFINGRVSFTPETLPVEYKPLLLLSLMELYYYIQTSRINYPLLPNIVKACDNLVNYVMTFIQHDWNSALLYDDIIKNVDSYSGYDRFDIQYQLVNYFLDQLAQKEIKKKKENRFLMLENLADKWNRTILGAKFCRDLGEISTDLQLNVQTNFIRKNLEKFNLKDNFLNDYILNVRNSVYNFYYCNAVASNFITGLPDYTNYCKLCEFSFKILSGIYNKIYALMAVIRLFQLYFNVQRLAVSMKEIAVLYDQAVFDRARLAFSIFKPSESLPFTTFLNPEDKENEVIFKLNLV